MRSPVELVGGWIADRTMVKPQDSKSALAAVAVEKRVDDNLGAALVPGAGVIGDETAVATSVSATSGVARLATLMAVESPKGGQLVAWAREGLSACRQCDRELTPR